MLASNLLDISDAFIIWMILALPSNCGPQSPKWDWAFCWLTCGVTGLLDSDNLWREKPHTSSRNGNTNLGHLWHRREEMITEGNLFGNLLKHGFDFLKFTWFYQKKNIFPFRSETSLLFLFYTSASILFFIKKCHLVATNGEWAFHFSLTWFNQ